jgi:hypothetical protein
MKQTASLPLLIVPPPGLLSRPPFNNIIFSWDKIRYNKFVFNAGLNADISLASEPTGLYFRIRRVQTYIIFFVEA